KHIQPLQTQYEEQHERLNVARQKYVDNQRQNIENRAKVSFLNSLIPLIDRMVYTVKKKDVLSPNDVQYIKELTDDIDHKNALLTQWIQLRRGELNIKVETFPLQPLFEMLKRSKTAFSMKGITLEIEDTDYAVKADRILTLFMLNTLLDNASKFTPKGGRIVVSATQREEHVEVSVSDTGCGMDEEQLKRLFTANATISVASADQHLATAGHGFGLINCRGIIEKYRKVSRIFKDVLISAESRKGEGSRFFFRLPKGIVRMILLILSLNLTMTTVKAESLNDSSIVALTNRDFEAYDYFNNEYINELKENSIDRNL
ncbi:MAG: ATP-binding protein, partial [Prevotella sp.]|nr:ATP-binding protein [Prevotella sp.]